MNLLSRRKMLQSTALPIAGTFALPPLAVAVQEVSTPYQRNWLEMDYWVTPVFPIPALRRLQKFPRFCCRINVGCDDGPMKMAKGWPAKRLISHRVMRHRFIPNTPEGLHILRNS
jgi:hypothetical protein